MSSREKLLNSLIYPINGHIRFEVDDVLNLQAHQYSDRVRVGKGEWYIKAGRRDGNDVERDLTVSLARCSKEEIYYIHRKFRIINQQKPGRDLTDTAGYDSWMCVNWSKLLSDGYVKDDKIIIDCWFRIDSEEELLRRSNDFFERPDEQDLEMILEKMKVPSEQEFFEMEVNVADIQEKEHFTDETTVFGLPVRLSFNNLRYLWIHVHFNWKDESEWWRSRIAFSVRFVNWTDTNLSISKENEHLYKKSSPSQSIWFNSVDVMDFAKGFVKDGKLKVQVFVRLLESYGFDEQTNRGIQMPMRKMTDVLLQGNMWFCDVSKMVLAQQSSYFKDLFASKPNQYEIVIENVDEYNFPRFLQLVHNVDTDICEENAQSILEVIDRFKAPECFKRCDSLLMRKDFGHIMRILENVMDWVFKYPLPRLQKILLRKIKDDEMFEMDSEQQKKILEWKTIADRLKREEEVETRDGTDFGQKSEFTNVEIKVAGHSYYASKQILSNASNYFMKRFYEPFSEEEAVISDLEVSHSNFELLLTHIYHPTRPATNVNIDSLLQLAHQFSVPRLMDKCEEYLVLNNFLSLIDKLEYAGKFDLPLLLAACLKVARRDMRKVTSHHKFPLLAPNVVKELSAIEHEDLEDSSGSDFDDEEEEDENLNYLL